MLQLYQNFVEIQDQDVVLDLGIGEGRLATLLMKPSIEYVGVDLSLKMVHQAKEKLSYKNEGFSHLVLADAENLPFRDRSFSKLVCFETTFFIPNQGKLIQEISRTLDENGVFYGEFLNKSNLHVLLNDLVLNRIFNVLVKNLSKVNAITKWIFYMVRKATKKEYGFKNEWIKVFKDFGVPKHYALPSSVFFRLLYKNNLRALDALGIRNGRFWKDDSSEFCPRILVKVVHK